jgi:hypothetical protein
MHFIRMRLNKHGRSYQSFQHKKAPDRIFVRLAVASEHVAPRRVEQVVFPELVKIRRLLVEYDRAHHAHGKIEVLVRADAKRGPQKIPCPCMSPMVKSSPRIRGWEVVADGGGEAVLVHGEEPSGGLTLHYIDRLSFIRNKRTIY